MKTIVVAIFVFCSTSLTFCQTEELPRRGIINGYALELAKPEYSQKMKDLCASGKVEIEILLSESGEVLETEVLSGDELLHDTSLSAIKSSRFPGSQIKTRGTIVYNFPDETKCIDVGNVYGKWKAKPMFSIPSSAKPENETEITVRLGIDGITGKLRAVHVTGGDASIITVIENEARKLRFSPTFINSPPLLVKAYLKLKIGRDGKVEIVR